jgi:hypothetical protein
MIAYDDVGFDREYAVILFALILLVGFLLNRSKWQITIILYVGFALIGCVCLAIRLILP